MIRCLNWKPVSLVTIWKRWRAPSGSARPGQYTEGNWPESVRREFKVAKKLKFVTGTNQSDIISAPDRDNRGSPRDRAENHPASLSFSLKVVATETLSNTASTATLASAICSSSGMPSFLQVSSSWDRLHPATASVACRAGGRYNRRSDIDRGYAPAPISAPSSTAGAGRRPGAIPAIHSRLALLGRDVALPRLPTGPGARSISISVMKPYLTLRRIVGDLLLFVFAAMLMPPPATRTRSRSFTISRPPPLTSSMVEFQPKLARSAQAASFSSHPHGRRDMADRHLLAGTGEPESSSSRRPNQGQSGGFPPAVPEWRNRWCCTADHQRIQRQRPRAPPVSGRVSK